MFKSKNEAVQLSLTKNKQKTTKKLIKIKLKIKADSLTVDGQNPPILLNNVFIKLYFIFVCVW